MADDESDRPRSKRWIAFVALPVFYVLSIGPATRLIKGLLEGSLGWSNRAAEMTFQFYSVIYAPLIWSGQLFPWFNDALESYCELFQ